MMKSGMINLRGGGDGVSPSFGLSRLGEEREVVNQLVITFQQTCTYYAILLLLYRAVLLCCDHRHVRSKVWLLQGFCALFSGLQKAFKWAITRPWNRAVRFSGGQ